MSLKFTITDGNPGSIVFSFDMGVLEVYKGEEWFSISSGEEISFDSTLEIRGESVTTSQTNHFQIRGGTVAISGSINALIDREAGSSSFQNDDQFAYMFYGQSRIVDASEMTFPETSLRKGCYKYMFASCSNLVNPPEELPATNLAVNCYDSMFASCTKLVTTPEIPRATPQNYSHQKMFSGCSALIGYTATTGSYTRTITLGTDEEGQSGWKDGMFENINSAGNVPATPDAGATYYFFEDPGSPLSDQKILPDYGKYKKG